MLADGWLYPVWVVGASRMREVEDAWPAPGSKLHHSVGVWPLLIDDTTEVLEAVPGVSLTLRARAWPVGEAHVHLRLTPHGADTEIRIEEKAVSGPGALVPPPLEGLDPEVAQHRDPAPAGLPGRAAPVSAPTRVVLVTGREQRHRRGDGPRRRRPRRPRRAPGPRRRTASSGSRPTASRLGAARPVAHDGRRRRPRGGGGRPSPRCWPSTAASTRCRERAGWWPTAGSRTCPRDVFDGVLRTNLSAR